MNRRQWVDPERMMPAWISQRQRFAFASVLLRCRFDDRKGVRPVKQFVEAQVLFPTWSDSRKKHCKKLRRLTRKVLFQNKHRRRSRGTTVIFLFVVLSMLGSVVWRYTSNTGHTLYICLHIILAYITCNAGLRTRSMTRPLSLSAL